MERIYALYRHNAGVSEGAGQADVNHSSCTMEALQIRTVRTRWCRHTLPWALRHSSDNKILCTSLPCLVEVRTPRTIRHKKYLSNKETVRKLQGKDSRGLFICVKKEVISVVSVSYWQTSLPLDKGSSLSRKSGKQDARLG